VSRGLLRPLVAETIGTFALVFAGCGAVMVDAKTHQLGHVGVALTFGLVIMFGLPVCVRGEQTRPAELTAHVVEEEWAA
jgi:glycerol uptake facilitator-like aquaporin